MGCIIATISVVETRRIIRSLFECTWTHGIWIHTSLFYKNALHFWNYLYRTSEHGEIFNMLPFLAIDHNYCRWSLWAHRIWPLITRAFTSSGWLEKRKYLPTFFVINTSKKSRTNCLINIILNLSFYCIHRFNDAVCCCCCFFLFFRLALLCVHSPFSHDFLTLLIPFLVRCSWWNYSRSHHGWENMRRERGIRLFQNGFWFFCF